MADRWRDFKMKASKLADCGQNEEFWKGDFLDLSL